MIGSSLTTVSALANILESGLTVASKTLVILEDDLTGGKADETISFALDGVSYEIDLSTKNADKMRKGLAQFIAASRRVGGRSAKGRGAATGGKQETQAIRAWAKDQGLEINDRGRVSAQIREAYEAAKG